MAKVVNQQTQAIQIANNLIGLSQSLISIYQQMVVLDAAWTDTGAATVLANMGTVVLNTDGSTGAVDGAPNVAHPINPTLYPTMNRAISSNQIAQLKTILDGIVAYVGGSAVTTQAGARAILNIAVGG
jgi:hypothetical protein